jgi:nucleoid-associated protein YgaU
MPNDAKLGLVVGVGLVIVIAVVFFRREPAAADTGQEAAAAVTPTPADARPAPRNQVPAPPTGAATRHVVQEGDTLASLARRYYQDDRKCLDIYRANQNVLSSPDRLRPGMVLVIPDLAAAPR